MIIIRIAAGIILAVLILGYWPLFVGAGVAATVIFFLTVYWIANPQDFIGALWVGGPWGILAAVYLLVTRRSAILSRIRRLPRLRRAPQ